MSDRAVGEILRDVVRDVQDLMRSEVRLAKAEITEQVDRAKGVSGYMGGAAVMGLLAGMSLVATCIAALATAMPVWAAAGIVTVVLGAAGFFLFQSGRSTFRNFHAVPKQTVETLKEDVEWAKQRTR